VSRSFSFSLLSSRSFRQLCLFLSLDELLFPSIRRESSWMLPSTRIHIKREKKKKKGPGGIFLFFSHIYEKRKKKRFFIFLFIKCWWWEPTVFLSCRSVSSSIQTPNFRPFSLFLIPIEEYYARAERISSSRRVKGASYLISDGADPFYILHIYNIAI
jgi:hypothetical protein